MNKRYRNKSILFFLGLAMSVTGYVLITAYFGWKLALFILIIDIGRKLDRSV